MKMGAHTKGLFRGLLGMQRFLMSIGVSRAIRGLPLAYPAYTYLYRRWAPRDNVAVESHGQKLFIDPADMGMARAFLLSHGDWEEAESRIFSSSLKPGMTFVDVGANIGYYTLLAARLVGSQGRVFAFEPCPENFQLLQRSVQANGHTNVTLVPKAVSDRSGPAILQLDRNSSGGHSLSGFRGGARSIAVETISLDEYFASYAGSIDVVKTDTEGADPAVFRGMHGLLERNPSLVLFTEFYPRAMQGMGYVPDDYLRDLAACGLRVYSIDEDTGETAPLESARVSQFIAPLLQKGARRDVLNLMCIRDTRAAMARHAAQGSAV
jgi:FkbM family methyltransferase